MKNHHARAAGMLCRDPAFRRYLDQRARARFGADVPDGTHTEEDAGDWLRRACGVASRSEIDGNPSAAATLRMIQNRFNRWRARRQSSQGERSC